MLPTRVKLKRAYDEVEQTPRGLWLGKTEKHVDKRPKLEKVEKATSVSTQPSDSAAAKSTPSPESEEQLSLPLDILARARDTIVLDSAVSNRPPLPQQSKPSAGESFTNTETRLPERERKSTTVPRNGLPTQSQKTVGTQSSTPGQQVDTDILNATPSPEHPDVRKMVQPPLNTVSSTASKALDAQVSELSARTTPKRASEEVRTKSSTSIQPSHTPAGVATPELESSQTPVSLGSNLPSVAAANTSRQEPLRPKQSNSISPESTARTQPRTPEVGQSRITAPDQPLVQASEKDPDEEIVRKEASTPAQMVDVVLTKATLESEPSRQRPSVAILASNPAGAPSDVQASNATAKPASEQARKKEALASDRPSSASAPKVTSEPELELFSLSSSMAKVHVTPAHGQTASEVAPLPKQLDPTAAELASKSETRLPEDARGSITPQPDVVRARPHLSTTSNAAQPYASTSSNNSRCQTPANELYRSYRPPGMESNSVGPSRGNHRPYQSYSPQVYQPYTNNPQSYQPWFNNPQAYSNNPQPHRSYTNDIQQHQPIEEEDSSSSDTNGVSAPRKKGKKKKIRKRGGKKKQQPGAVNNKDDDEESEISNNRGNELPDTEEKDRGTHRDTHGHGRKANNFQHPTPIKEDKPSTQAAVNPGPKHIQPDPNSNRSRKKNRWFGPVTALALKNLPNSHPNPLHLISRNFEAVMVALHVNALVCRAVGGHDVGNYPTETGARKGLERWVGYDVVAVDDGDDEDDVESYATNTGAVKAGVAGRFLLATCESTEPDDGAEIIDDGSLRKSDIAISSSSVAGQLGTLTVVLERDAKIALATTTSAGIDEGLPPSSLLGSSIFIGGEAVERFDLTEMMDKFTIGSEWPSLTNSVFGDHPQYSPLETPNASQEYTREDTFSSTDAPDWARTIVQTAKASQRPQNKHSEDLLSLLNLSTSARIQASMARKFQETPSGYYSLLQQTSRTAAKVYNSSHSTLLPTLKELANDGTLQAFASMKAQYERRIGALRDSKRLDQRRIKELEQQVWFLRSARFGVEEVGEARVDV